MSDVLLLKTQGEVIDPPQWPRTLGKSHGRTGKALFDCREAKFSSLGKAEARTHLHPPKALQKVVVAVVVGGGEMTGALPALDSGLELELELGLRR